MGFSGTDPGVSKDAISAGISAVGPSDTSAELSASGDGYVGELLRTPRRQAERLGALLPRDGAA